jgi:uncharacterized protein
MIKPSVTKLSKIISIRVIRITLIIVTIQIAIGCALQRKVIFPGQKLEPSYVFSPYKNGKEIKIKTEDGVILSAIKYNNFKSEKIILYFHGNAESLESWRYEFGDLEYLNKDMIIFDYRGYGKSEGNVSEKGLYLDAKGVYEYALSMGYKDSNIIIYGRSIGTGIAVDVAQNKNIDALVLESPYSSLRKMIYNEYWYMLPFFYLSYSFNSCEKMKNIRTKVLFLHGDKDEVIPAKYSKDLEKCFEGSKRYIQIKNGMHNNLGQFPQKRNAVEEFLK